MQGISYTLYILVMCAALLGILLNLLSLSVFICKGAIERIKGNAMINIWLLFLGKGKVSRKNQSKCMLFLAWPLTCLDSLPLLSAALPSLLNARFPESQRGHLFSWLLDQHRRCAFTLPECLSPTAVLFGLWFICHFMLGGLSYHPRQRL